MNRCAELGADDAQYERSEIEPHNAANMEDEVSENEYSSRSER